MKTNVTMIRKMGNFEVNQRTKDGFFNATKLLKQWNESLGMKKEVSKFFELEQTNEFINVLMIEENLHTQDLTYVKSRASRGENSGTWMHPILFIKFAMWINPRFEYFVIKFVYDQLIEFRCLAGDNYKGLTSAVNHFQNVDYVQLAQGLNYIVFKEHYAGIRQKANQQQLKDLVEVQQQLAFSVRMGYIRTFDQLITEMRRIYEMKHLNYLR
jgi:hypothetical protein